jgi:tripartite-type tricarboxylate transporter receptor subunit TctC
LFAKRAGLDMIHVPYRGGAQMVTDLMAGHVDMYLGNASEILPQASSGAIKLLGVSSPNRLADQPNLPSIGETLPGYVINAWNGLLAPAGTPKPIIDRLERETIKAAHEPAVIEKLGRLGIVAAGTTAADFVATIQTERAAFRDAVAAAGIAASD